MTKKILLFVIVLALASPCLATDYYIKNGGNDGAAGTSDGTAWASLDKIRTSVSAGDTVYLKRGSTWTDDATASYAAIYIEDKSNITVDAYDSGAKPVVDVTGQNDTGGDHNYPDYCALEIRGTAANITIQNLSIKGGYDTAAIFIYAGTGNSIEDCDISGKGRNDYSENMVLVRGNIVTFDGCFFDAITLTGSDSYGAHIECKYGGYVHLYDNTFYGMTYNTIRIVQSGSPGNTLYWDRNFFYDFKTGHSVNRVFWIRAEGSASGTNTFVIRNNVVDFRSCPGGNCETFHVATLYSTTPVVHLVNNTIVDNGSADQLLRSSQAQTVYLDNNIAYDSGWFVKFSNTYPTVHARSNICYSCTGWASGDTFDTDTNNVTTDPNLADPTFSTNGDATDAYLTASSTAARDAGTGTPGSGNYPSDDHAGDPRSGTIDIGADEYGGDTTPPVMQIIIGD